jgi:cupin fold WbuC family metalloprotein
MHQVEIISNGMTPLAYIVRAGWMPESTEFLTPNHFGQQMGMIVYGAGTQIQPHLHLPVVREVHGTTECIVVRKGACDLDIYDQSKQLIETRSLKTGDIVLLLGGGHGFRMTEDTILFEVKQGPYVGAADKERF